jgi:molybdopterin-containing oxidoreductase family iron-sulfur binding subunit
MDETSSSCKYVAAASHYLESWGDFQFINGEYSICQPTIKTLFDTRQFDECLLKWSGNNIPLYDVLKDNWNSNILESNFSWNKAIHDGVYSVKDNFKPKLVNIDFSDSIKNLIDNKVEGYELCLYSKIGMGDGQQANK